jgi:multidrug resistance efflux pump
MLDDAELKLRVDQAQAQVEQAKAAVRQAEEKIELRPGQAFDPNRVAEVANAQKYARSGREEFASRGEVDRVRRRLAFFLRLQRAQRDQLKEQYEVRTRPGASELRGGDVARTNVANAEAAARVRAKESFVRCLFAD